MNYFLMTEDNPKTAKSQPLGWYTLILHLLPYNFSGYQVCAKADGCQVECLAWSGRGSMDSTLNARHRRTLQFFEDRERFMRLLASDIERGLLVAEQKGHKLAVRLNGTSDIPWEKIRTGEHRNLMAMFPQVQFYDYTKIVGRTIPDNYHLTYSASGASPLTRQLLDQGNNVAIIFKGSRPPSLFGYPIIDGDAHDLRFLDPSPSIVGLRFKPPRYTGIDLAA